MPVERIVINEQDQSQGRVVLADVFNVLVVDDECYTTLDETLYEDSGKFLEKYPIAKDKDGKITTASNYAANDFINLGLGVYVTNADNMIKFKDKYRFDVAFIFDAHGTDLEEVNKLISARLDCLYFAPDWSEDLGSEDDTENGVQGTGTLARVQEVGGLLTLPSYGTIYSPAVELPNGLQLPASYTFIRNFATSIAAGNPAWYPIAGVNRGLVNYIAGTIRTVDDDEALNSQDKDQVAHSNYNPIVNLSTTYGNVLWGQRTLLKENTSLRSVHVRILCNMIKKRIFNICLNLLFEMNDLVLWNEFRGLLSPYLSRIKFGRGLVDYEIVMDQAAQINGGTDEMTVKGYVRIQPTRAAEYFNIDFTLTSGGAEVGSEE